MPGHWPMRVRPADPHPDHHANIPEHARCPCHPAALVPRLVVTFTFPSPARPEWNTSFLHIPAIAPQHIDSHQRHGPILSTGSCREAGQRYSDAAVSSSSQDNGSNLGSKSSCKICSILYATSLVDARASGSFVFSGRWPPRYRVIDSRLTPYISTQRRRHLISRLLVGHAFSHWHLAHAGYSFGSIR